MAYTRPWDQVNNLLGSRDADEIDDASRETHLDLTERFADIVKDVTADPWELKTIGASAGDQNIVRVAAICGSVTQGVRTVAGDTSVGPTTVGGAGALGLAIPLILPVNATLTSVEVYGFRTAPGAVVSLSVAQLDDVSGFASLGTQSLASVQSTMQFNGVALTHGVTDTESLFAALLAQADPSGIATARIASIRYLYTVPGA